MLSTRRLFSLHLRVMLLLFAILPGMFALTAPVTLTQVISREHPLCDVAGSHMVLGRDGLVYLSSGEYLLRIARDGTGKLGSKVTYATWGAAANEDGVMATANAHFNHSVNLWDAHFQPLGAVSDFLSSDPTEWFGPDDVQAGASGDFYGMDQNRNRIVRVAVPGKMVTTYALTGAGDFVRKLVKFRVCEAQRRFYLAPLDGQIKALDFDNKLLWTIQAGINGNPWEGYTGAFDSDDAGNVYVLLNNTDTVKVYGPDGQPRGEIKLRLGARKGRIDSLCVAGNEILVKRPHPVELFQVYDRASGALKQVVSADVEQLDVTFPSDVWTAGQAVPLTISFQSPNPNNKPHWHIWLRPLNVPDFTELPRQQGQITVPADAGGLYQLRVTPDIQGGTAEYQVQTVVDIRRAGAVGSLAIFTPANRLYYGQGEEIPVSVLCRHRADASPPPFVVVRLLDGAHVSGETTVALALDKPTQFTLPGALTSALHPGRYLLTTSQPGFTVAGQTLDIGPGMPSPPAFSIVQHGDYSMGFPGGTYLEAPENVAHHLARTLKLGTNMFVDRLGHAGAGGIGYIDAGTGGEALVERLKNDPLAPAPEKAQFESPLKQSLAGYGAHGIEERAILLYMDAGLPVGTGFDQRTPAQYAGDIGKVSTALAPYPAFRGWSWAANWWINPSGAAAAKTPEQKTAYETALKQANDTGAWDPVLDQVSDIWINYAVDAEKQFRAVLEKVAPGKISAMTGPYRQPGIIPPLTFAHADEVDLHYQSEQIQPPQVTPHNVDFYKRPGKRAWGHPECWNDDGTGGMLYPTLFQMAMRGADGIGWSGNVPAWGSGASDTRATGPGTVSIFRNLSDFFTRYGPWLITLHAHDPVAIVVSERMLRIDTWHNIGGLYFDRLFEAYNACLYAHRPASFVFAEDIQPDTLRQFNAVLVVGQRVEFDPALAQALHAAQAAGMPIYADGTCRDALVKDYLPLGVGFSLLEKDPSAWQDDSAYARFPAYFTAEAALLDKAFAQRVPPVARVDNPQIMLTERAAGAGRYLWVVNNTALGLDPGLAWRMCLIMSQRLPVTAAVGLKLRKNELSKAAVYDLFAQQRVTPVNGVVQADLRCLPARLYAILPAPIDHVVVRGPRQVTAGGTFSWEAGVRDAGNQPINAAIPLRVRLLAADGTVLQQRFLGALPVARGTFTVPLNAPAGALALEVSELCSGKTARLPIPGALTGAVLLTAVQQGTPAAPVASVQGKAVAGPAPIGSQFGQHLKDITVTPDGALALINAMNWGENLYALDLRDGTLKWRQRIGHHFAYGPQAITDGAVVQGFDAYTAAGYHLYLLDAAGHPLRRFALPGYPKRAVSWAAGSSLLDRINNFAVPPAGSWVAAAGDLGLAVWERGGKLRWSQQWWKTTRKREVLLAGDEETLITLDGMTVTAYSALDGAQRWQLTLALTGALQGGVVSTDHSTLALCSDTDGGRIYLLRNGKLLNTLASPADALALSADGAHLAVTTGSQLKWYATNGGLEWCFTGDDVLRAPRISTDGGRVVVGSELGSLYVLDSAGTLCHTRDLGALPVAAWLPGGDLLVATWMGKVVCLHADYTVRWQTRITSAVSDLSSKLLTVDPTPTVAVSGWSNAAETPAALTPNLLKETQALITAVEEKDGSGHSFTQSVDLLRDGKPEAPAAPWLGWTDVNYIDSGWRGHLALQIDTFHTQVKLTGITFVEDPAHPESWLRDMRLQYWDAEKELWLDGPYLLSDAATHTHWFAQPIEAAKFRLISTGGGSWPAGNMRLGELVLHGEVLGASHPDAVAKRPLAVLFDEQEGDIKAALQNGNNPQFIFKYDDAYSGGKCLALKDAGAATPTYMPPFGHTIPNWNFEIAEHPQPGQYRWLQFAWKALSPKTTSIALLIGGPWPSGGVNVTAGSYDWGQGTLVTKKMADTPPQQWQVVRIDLWDLLKHPLRIQCMQLAAVGGGAAFDQIVLGRSEADLPVGGK